MAKAKPRTKIRTVRALPDVWTRLDELADRQATYANTIIVDLVEDHLARNGLPAPARPRAPRPPAPKPRQALADAERKAAHLAAKPPPKSWRAALAKVPLGPPPVKPGSRLIDKHKPRRSGRRL